VIINGWLVLDVMVVVSIYFFGYHMGRSDGYHSGRRALIREQRREQDELLAKRIERDNPGPRLRVRNVRVRVPFDDEAER
jgi:hypothetical protein